MRTIAHDMIVSVTGQGWNYGLARILIDTDGNGAVFVPPGMEPAKVLTGITVGGGGKGAAVGPQGGQVTFTRRGSSCSFKLAKCQVTTQQLNTRWT